MERTPLEMLFQCCFSEKECLSAEATIVALHLVEKLLITASDSSDRDLRAALKHNFTLQEEIGFSNFYDLEISMSELTVFMSQVVAKLNGAPQEQLHAAMIMKQADSIAEVEKSAREFLKNRWRENEGAASRLLSVLWDDE